MLQSSSECVKSTNSIGYPFQDGQIGPDRKQFWRYCQRVAGASAHRARRAELPHNINAHDIDRLLVDQKFKCAVSGLPLEITRQKLGGPFGPSLDRIELRLGYVKGNVRVVCQIANLAMNYWGIGALERLVQAMSLTDGTAGAS